MVTGLFRGTCSKYLISDSDTDWHVREVQKTDMGPLYLPDGDFQYSLYGAASYAYGKALESGSTPILACIMPQYIECVYTPLNKVRFIRIGTRQGVEEAISFYNDHEDSIPQFLRENNNRLHLLLEEYLEHRKAGKRTFRD